MKELTRIPLGGSFNQRVAICPKESCKHAEESAIGSPCLRARASS